MNSGDHPSAAPVAAYYLGIQCGSFSTEPCPVRVILACRDDVMDRFR
jgi:hypothetical protein